MKIKACIFDLDGTILYTLDSIAKAGNRMLETLGLPPRPVDEYRFHCGDGSDTLVRRCLTAAGGLNEDNLRRGMSLNREYLAEDPLFGVKPYDGVPEALEELKRTGVRLAVFTNKPDDAAQPAVKTLYGDLFEIIRGQRGGVPVKPDPTGALMISEAFGVRPEECAYFGDTWTDMRTGRCAGFYTVGVLWGYRDRAELLENGAQRLITHPREIVPVICGKDELSDCGGSR